jgi:signal transduction histidine kinase
VRRRQLEQQLHDGPALRLAALSLRLGLCSHQAGDDNGLRECLDESPGRLHTVLQELRNVASQIYPPVRRRGWARRSKRWPNSTGFRSPCTRPKRGIAPARREV